jgi:hypothetical protein
MCKIAVCFLVYDNISQPLAWKYFYNLAKGKCNFYIHRKNRDNIIDGFEKETVEWHHETGWGTIESIQTIIKLFDEALSDKDNTRFVVVSGSCIPVLDFNTINQFIFNQSKSIISKYKKKDKLYFKSRYDLIDNDYFTYTDLFKCDAQGSIFNRNDTELFVQTIDKYLPYFSKCKCIDETYFATVLYINKIKILNYHTIYKTRNTQIQFDNRPIYLNSISDFDMMTIVRAGVLFARKFDQTAFNFKKLIEIGRISSPIINNLLVIAPSPNGFML